MNIDPELIWQGECISLMKAMPSGPDNLWQPKHNTLYGKILDVLGKELGEQAVHHTILYDKWRPSPARLLEIGAQLAFPHPSPDEAYAETMHKAEHLGLYASGGPRFYSLGPPTFSHAVVAVTIAHCGGWRAICTGEANYAEGISKQFRSAYQRNLQKYLQDCVRHLLEPSPFTAYVEHPYKPYVIPHGWMPMVGKEPDDRFLLED